MSRHARSPQTLAGDRSAAVVGDDLPVRLRAWDGSEAGPRRRAGRVVLRNRRALRRLLWRPGELGLARAYVTGDLDVEGDLDDGLPPGVGVRPRPGRRIVHVGAP